MFLPVERYLVFRSPLKWVLTTPPVLVLVGLAFTWGVATGVYRTFPWKWIDFVGHQIIRTVHQTDSDPRVQFPRVVQPIYTGLLNFDLTIVPGAVPGEAGGLAVIPGGLLVARDTNLHYFDEKQDHLQALSWTLPSHDRNNVVSESFSGRTIRPSDMRYHDIEVADIDGQRHLFVTYNKFDPAGKCFYFRLDEAILPKEWQNLSQHSQTNLSWSEVLRAKPCLPASPDRNTFGGNQGGGRVVIRAGRLLVATGDFEFDGVGRKKPAVSQIEGSDYGRVLERRKDSKEWIELSRGHRNPQGMAFDRDGQLWVAEHGPMGGDELNLIQQGVDYGWPSVTLGVLYTHIESDAKSWPPNPYQGRHVGYQAPVFAWMPSIATSSLALVEEVDPRWDGDLLLGTLIGRSLHRIRLDGTKVLYDEMIPLNGKVRDVAVSNGRIYILFDDGRFGYMTPHRKLYANPIQARSTQLLVEAGCIVCHSKPTVPKLAGLLGADIASQPNVQYSFALRSIPGRWTKERLMAFLRSPARFAPDTTMLNPGLDAETLEKLIEELQVEAVRASQSPFWAAWPKGCAFRIESPVINHWH